MKLLLMATFVYVLLFSLGNLGVCIKNKFSTVVVCDATVLYLSILLLRFSSYSSDTAFIDHTVIEGAVYKSFYYNFRIDSSSRIYIFTQAAEFVSSIEDLYQTAVWFERESSEMFNIFYRNSTDTRNLLLAYNLQFGPLCKEVSCVGLGQIHFDIGFNTLF